MNRLPHLPARLFLLACLLPLLCASCLAPPALDAPGFEDTLPLLGQGEQEVIRGLGLTAVQPTQTADSAREEYVLESPVEGNDCTVCLTFYNDIFQGIEYAFSDTDAAFGYAQRLREALGQRYGEKTTHPIQSDVQQCFDDLSGSGELEPSHLYSEDWTPELDAGQMEKMLGGLAASRIDVRFSLFTLESGGIVSVRCSAVPAAE